MDKNEIEEKLDRLKHEVDALQISVLSDVKPWYRQASVIISVLALIFSFSTTYVANQRTELLDIQSEKKELRDLLIRLSEFPKETLEFEMSVDSNQNALSNYQGYVATETSFLVSEAASIAERLPPGIVTAPEYINIASSMQNMMRTDQAIKFYELASISAVDFNTEAASFKGLGKTLFQAKRSDEGRLAFSKIDGLIGKYNGVNPEFIYAVILDVKKDIVFHEYTFAKDKQKALSAVKEAKTIMNMPDASISKRRFLPEFEWLENSINKGTALF